MIKIESSQPQLPGSSAPFPWSSSPVEHFAPLLPMPVSARGQVQGQVSTARQQRQQQPVPPPQRMTTTTTTATATSRQMEVIDLREDDDEPEVPKKKRKIPWAKDGGAAVAAPPSRTARTRADRTPAQREVPKLPWDMTASDFKRASRRNVEQQRRGLSTRAGKEGPALGGGEKKKKELRQTKLMLSTEQTHVLDLVLESGKSVFFTGSAGLLPPFFFFFALLPLSVVPLQHNRKEKKKN